MQLAIKALRRPATRLAILRLRFPTLSSTISYKQVSSIHFAVMASSKAVLVTGGNSGIGYETVKALLESKEPYHVLLAARSAAKASAAVESLRKDCPETANVVEPVEVDLNSDDSIERAFAEVQRSPGRLDVLINNAGTCLIPAISRVFCEAHVTPGATFDLEYLAGRVSQREAFTKAYDVNVAGTHVLTTAFMPLLIAAPDPRLIFVAGLANMQQASERYFPTPPQPAGWPKPKMEFDTIAYRCSKVALNMLMLDWNHKLSADGVKVWAVGPGFLATNLGAVPEKAREMGAGHPSIGAKLLRSVVEGERDADVGKIVVKDGLSRF